MKNGQAVAAFERAFAEYVGARYAIACANGTVTLQAALVALGVKPGDRVAVPPLTMSATTIAVLNVGAVPVFVDVDPETWLAVPGDTGGWDGSCRWGIMVSLYGLHYPGWGFGLVDDAAQTLRPHGGAAFTSYSFQASKILALGEGGALATDDPELAARARSYLSLGYDMRPDQPRIDPAVLKSPTYARHHQYPCINGRMNDLTAAEGLRAVECDRSDRCVHLCKSLRQTAASFYRDVIAGCDWLTPQLVPPGWTHDYWAYAVAITDACPLVTDRVIRWGLLANLIEKHGGERPFGAWRLTYHEPVFRHLAADGTCPVAEALQPRILQFQTNSLPSAERNARALRRALEEVSR